ncbi:MAG: NifU family protein [Candidatus Nitrohelix vancouverensis]|uniref:NifU family protein n=1 Tax=Candidatus Nitrohelix vancouverensis TaxID=2705534 RepID=A0A7T0G370_9BACT|nr:MAG: NifU family protein [Candidatus Nitrohelix vancouverensis]
MGIFGDLIKKITGAGNGSAGNEAAPTETVTGTAKPVYKVLRVQPTPNPEAFQFTLDQRAIEEGKTKTFDSADDAKGNAFGEKIFQIFGVQNVFVKDDFVTVTKSPTVGWSTIMEKINNVLEESFEFQTVADEPRVQEEDSILDSFDKENFINLPTEEKSRIIEALLDKGVRPALANDGGGLEVLAIDGSVVKIHYQGACGSCPSSTMGTLQYIESFLRDAAHPDLSVEAG